MVDNFMKETFEVGEMVATSGSFSDGDLSYVKKFDIVGFLNHSRYNHIESGKISFIDYYKVYTKDDRVRVGDIITSRNIKFKVSSVYENKSPVNSYSFYDLQLEVIS